MTEMCGCGLPLHYNDPEVEAKVRAIIAEKGVTVVVGMLDGDHAYRVPRHYIAKHGLAAAELETLAEQYGWERV